MDPFTKEELEQGLSTKTLGRYSVLLDSIDSTNAEARRRLYQCIPDGTVLIADSQTGGRGRRGRRWVSEPGCGLWMTAVIRPFMAAEEMQKLTLLIGLAVCSAVEHMANGVIRPAIKWPNDVLVNGKKLCGILCESAVDSSGERMALAGIGVNTRRPVAGWGGAEGIAVSMEEACGAAPGRLELAAAILNRMEQLMDRWQAEGFKAVAAEYREYMLQPGTLVEIADGEQCKRGRIEGLDDRGGLLVRLDGGSVECVVSGEISIRSVCADA